MLGLVGGSVEWCSKSSLIPTLLFLDLEALEGHGIASKDTRHKSFHDIKLSPTTPLQA